MEAVAVLEEAVAATETKALWVFGYGSLCWRPGFQFHKAVPGHVQGFERKFWQGNVTHRGTEEKPGRVATLVETPKGMVHGVAFAISGEDAIPYLSQRECKLGGYISNFTEFYPINGEPFKVMVYIANQKNPLWLGDAGLSEIANQIVQSEGSSGHNVEYVVRLANFMRHHFPNYIDDHLFSLEKEILNIVKSKQMCLRTLMGSGEGCLMFVKEQRRRSTENLDNQERIETFEHTARVPEKMLRCLNI